MRIVVTKDGSKSLHSERYDETYHSGQGALTESRMLFLGASGTAARLAAGDATTVTELGFGTGLSFFLAADVAFTHDTLLTFVSFELELPPADLIAGLGYEAALEHPELLSAFLTWRESLEQTTGTAEFTYGPATLILVFGDLVEEVPRYQFGEVHAVLLDAFSPRTNPEPWQEHVLGAVIAPVVTGGVVVTFTVAGAVRRALEQCGLTVQKIPGPPGGKKEVLRGIRL